MTNHPIYLDYQATTPCAPEVIEAMLPYFGEKFGNPHSGEHVYGWEADAAIEIAREHIADLIGASPDEIIFTSGATESNNLALKGVMEFYGKKKNHLITVATEHKCVIESCRYLERQGMKVTYLGVQPNGIIDLDQLKDAITEDTALISAMHVNNEIGVIQPIEEIGAICNEHNIFFHSDAAQSFGKLPIDVKQDNLSLLSISGHKIYGPKGIGALYVSKASRVRIAPHIHGGNQQKGLRSGTLPTPLVAGLGKAAALTHDTMDEELSRITSFYQQCLSELVDSTEGIVLNGDRDLRYPGNLNISIEGVQEQSLVTSLRELALSSGSACSSGSASPSYVLQALGVDKQLIKSSIRIGIGRYTSQQDISEAISKLQDTISQLRS